jgi:hypothetical protein
MRYFIKLSTILETHIWMMRDRGLWTPSVSITITVFSPDSPTRSRGNIGSGGRAPACCQVWRGVEYRRSVQGRMLLTELETSARTESKRMTNHNTPSTFTNGHARPLRNCPWTVATKYSSCRLKWSSKIEKMTHCKTIFHLLSPETSLYTTLLKCNSRFECSVRYI